MSIVSNQLFVEIICICSLLFYLFVSQKYASAPSVISLRVFRHCAIGFSQNTNLYYPLPQSGVRGRGFGIIAPMELISVYINRSTPVILYSSLNICGNGIRTQILY